MDLSPEVIDLIGAWVRAQVIGIGEDQNILPAVFRKAAHEFLGRIWREAAVDQAIQISFRDQGTVLKNG